VRDVVGGLLVPLSIITISLPLLLYWLTKVYSEIVNDKVILLHSNRLAAQAHMRYPNALECLQNKETAIPADRLFRDLLEDWKLVRSMIGRDPSPLAFRIAALGFSTARFLYSPSNALVLPKATRRVLMVMATSVRYFAGVAGGRAAMIH
jgi:hypothetical protein